MTSGRRWNVRLSDCWSDNPAVCAPRDSQRLLAATAATYPTVSRLRFSHMMIRSAYVVGWTMVFDISALSAAFAVESASPSSRTPWDKLSPSRITPTCFHITSSMRARSHASDCATFGCVAASGICSSIGCWQTGMFSIALLSKSCGCQTVPSVSFAAARPARYP